MQLDNSTFELKRALRRRALTWVPDPVVMETHGGYGRLYSACYRAVPVGVVFEMDEKKATALAKQRPTWAVYQGDCVKALAEGAGSFLTVNVLDLDPYGEPWPALDAFLISERPRAETLVIVVNDGLRQKIQMGGAWQVESLGEAVQQFGADLFDVYLSVCRWLVEQKAAMTGYAVGRFVGYYCGRQGHMNHYAALLSKAGP